MAQFDLNLSTRPFPAYRLINLALLAVLILLVSLSAWQAVGFVRYSKMSRAIRPGEQDKRVEAEAVGKRVEELETKLDQPEAAAKLTEIEFLNRLIARKNLSWTRLVANLEDMVPDNVHLVSLTPNIGAKGVITLQIDMSGRSIADVAEFVGRLEHSPVFGKVAVFAEEKRDTNVSSDVGITLTTNYYPERDTR